MPMLKCSSERWVCAPHSLSAGTSTTPRLSLSFRVSAMGSLLDSILKSGRIRVNRFSRTVRASRLRSTGCSDAAPLYHPHYMMHACYAHGVVAAVFVDGIFKADFVDRCIMPGPRDQNRKILVNRRG